MNFCKFYTLLRPRQRYTRSVHVDYTNFILLLSKFNHYQIWIPYERHLSSSLYIFYPIFTVVFNQERVLLQKTYVQNKKILQSNPRFIIKSSFKSWVGNNVKKSGYNLSIVKKLWESSSCYFRLIVYQVLVRSRHQNPVVLTDFFWIYPYFTQIVNVWNWDRIEIKSG